MKNIFFDFLAEHNLTNKSLIKGYNYAEIKQIERLYDIEINGDFKFFFGKNRAL